MPVHTHVPLPTGTRELAMEPGSVLLETACFDAENVRSYLFLRPTHTLAINRPEQLPALFASVEQYVERGFHVAGFLGYECGYHFEKLDASSHAGSGMPLAWLGVYTNPYVFNHLTGVFESELPPSSAARAVNAGCPGFSIQDCRLEVSQADYFKCVETIKEHILAGDTYQVNFTGKVRFGFAGSPVALFTELRQKQKVRYAALMNADGNWILSLSPELFFRLRGRHIQLRPMKGTAPRERHAAEDEKHSSWLRDDQKNRSENVMIVDLLRNDLGRIAEVGSVRIDELFAVEKYETLLQMTSTVSGTLRRGLSWYDIFRALFPSGSVTGAPKIRTMEIIRKLEQEPRGVYTGAIGFISPKREAVFNVAIRTIVINGTRGEMGVGSGIVYDSLPSQEHAECVLKADFLTRGAEPPFRLLESILWDGGYVFLAEHLERMRVSADYFGFRFDETAVTASLRNHESRLAGGGRYKIRLLLDEDGRVTIEDALLEEQHLSGRVMISPVTVSSGDRFLYHKTTRRELHDAMFASARQRGFDEVIFLNERGEVTEGAISNVFISNGGKLHTPPVESGLLPGIWRRHVLRDRPEASENVLCLDDLRTADAIHVCNSVRGWRTVVLDQPAAAETTRLLS